jgi:hypothetical protein
MAECKACQKPLDQKASEIGSWCIDCIKDMSDTNTGNMGAKRNDIKKNKLIIMICAGIGAVVGLIIGVSLGPSDAEEIIGVIIGGIWAGGGYGTSWGFFINRVAFGWRTANAEGKDFGKVASNEVLFAFLHAVIGLFAGPIFFLFLVLRRNKWIKKFNKIIASEDAAIAEIDEYTSGKDINKADLSRKINIIADNFELANDGVSLADLDQLEIVQ